MFSSNNKKGFKSQEQMSAWEYEIVTPPAHPKLLKKHASLDHKVLMHLLVQDLSHKGPLMLFPLVTLLKSIQHASIEGILAPNSSKISKFIILLVISLKFIKKKIETKELIKVLDLDLNTINIQKSTASICFTYTKSNISLRTS